MHTLKTRVYHMKYSLECTDFLQTSSNIFRTSYRAI